MSRVINVAESWDKVYEAYQQVNFAAWDFNTIKESSKTELDNIKERLIIEEYINNIYKARLEYTTKMDSKYGKSIDVLSAIITGKYENIKSEAPSLREGFIGLSSAIGLSKQGVDKVAAKNVSYELLKGYKGDISDITNTSVGKYFEPTENDKKKLERIQAYVS